MLEDDTMVRAAAALEERVAADAAEEKSIEEVAEDVAGEEETDDELTKFLETVPKGGK